MKKLGNHAHNCAFSLYCYIIVQTWHRAKHSRSTLNMKHTRAHTPHTHTYIQTHWHTHPHPHTPTKGRNTHFIIHTCFYVSIHSHVRTRMFQASLQEIGFDLKKKEERKTIFYSFQMVKIGIYYNQACNWFVPYSAIHTHLKYLHETC